MTIRQLQYFASVCRTQNLSQSARELFVSQPTLTIAMKELERELGTALFVKKGTHIEVSEAGKRLIQEVEPLLSQYGRIERLAEGRLFDSRYLRLGFSIMAGSSLIPELYGRVQRALQGLRIETFEGSGARLLEKLENGELDAVITGGKYGEDAKWKDAFESMDLPGGGLRFCVAAGSEHGQRDSIELEDIGRIPLAMLDESFPISRNIEELFSSAGIALNVIIRTSQLFTVERFIISGEAGGFLPEEACGNPQLKVLHCPEVDSFRAFPVKLFWKKEAEQPLLKSFLSVIGQGLCEN
jgi:DNA-binding transcriptional LysR family regulator